MSVIENFEESTWRTLTPCEFLYSQYALSKIQLSDVINVFIFLLMAICHSCICILIVKTETMKDIRMILLKYTK